MNCQLPVADFITRSVTRNQWGYKPHLKVKTSERHRTGLTSRGPSLASSARQSKYPVSALPDTLSVTDSGTEAVNQQKSLIPSICWLIRSECQCHTNHRLRQWTFRPPSSTLSTDVRQHSFKISLDTQNNWQNTRPREPVLMRTERMTRPQIVPTIFRTTFQQRRQSRSRRSTVIGTTTGNGERATASSRSTSVRSMGSSHSVAPVVRFSGSRSHSPTPGALRRRVRGDAVRRPSPLRGNPICIRSRRVRIRASL